MIESLNFAGFTADSACIGFTRWTGIRKSDTKKIPSLRKICREGFYGRHRFHAATSTLDGKMEAYEARPRYHEMSATDSWEKTKAFFAQHLK